MCKPIYLQLSRQILNPFLLLIFFSVCHIDETQLVLSVNWHFLFGPSAIAFENGVHDLVTFLGGVAIVVFVGDVQDELCSDAADGDGFDLVDVDFAADG